jgi:hypothetical protein
MGSEENHEPRKPFHVSDRPLWLVALMFAFHLAWIAFCALWIPITFGKAISQRFGSPGFVLPAIIFVYALAPFVASFSELGRDYWNMLGKGGTARRATKNLLIFGAVCFVLAVAMRVFIT